MKILLNNFGLKFQSIPANIAESYARNIRSYADFVIFIARQKVQAIAKRRSGIILGADTIVVLDSKILGKPSSRKEAKKMLKLLSGRKHKVYTGISMLATDSQKTYEDFEVTNVKFRKLTEEEINFYVKSGSPMDKAGAYGIQDDFGSTFIERIEGDYSNVVGLPLVKTYTGLKRFLHFGNLS